MANNVDWQEWVHNFPESSFAEEFRTIKDKELNLILKRRKMIWYKTVLDSAAMGLSKLGTKSVHEKTVSLEDCPVTAEVMLYKSCRTREDERITVTKKRIDKIPKAFNPNPV